eukprot:gene8281-9165_t
MARSLRQSRMVRGRDAYHFKWPFIVNLNFHQKNPKWKICGGTIIMKRWILTAAHCLEDIPKGPQFVTVTTGRAKKKTSFFRKYIVDKVILHERYLEINSINATHFNWDYDIALLRLTRDVQHPSTVIGLAHLNSSVSDISGITCKSAGWGRQKEFQSESEIRNQNYIPSANLQEIDVPLLSRDECRRIHGKEVTDLIFCGGTLKDQTMTGCIGDSGSPLICQNATSPDEIVLAGIMIGGNSFCRTGTEYMTFTDVAKYHQWINKNIIMNSRN